jgi:hypothetical protein
MVSQIFLKRKNLNKKSSIKHDMFWIILIFIKLVLIGIKLKGNYG